MCICLFICFAWSPISGDCNVRIRCAVEIVANTLNVSRYMSNGRLVGRFERDYSASILFYFTIFNAVSFRSEAITFFFCFLNLIYSQCHRTILVHANGFVRFGVIFFFKFSCYLPYSWSLFLCDAISRDVLLAIMYETHEVISTKYTYLLAT